MAGTEEDDADSTKDANSKVDELLSMETLRESPLQWPERCKYHEVRTIHMHTFLKYPRFAVPGMEEFLTASETPIHTPTIDPAQILANDNMKAINREYRSDIITIPHTKVLLFSPEFARLPPEQLIEKIKSMHDQIYKLGIRESKEMTRGKLLGIFGARERQTKDVPPMRHS